MNASLTLFRLFACLAAGGLAATWLLPERGVSRGFFRFEAALYGALIAIGLAVAPGGAWSAHRGALAAAAVLSFVYAVVVAGLPERRSARPLIGAAALLALAGTGVEGHLAAGWLGAAAAGGSALLLGSAITAMTLGHWYLVMPALPPDPLMRVTRLYAGSVLLRIGAVVAAFAILDGQGRALDRFLDSAGLLLWPRLLFGLVMPGVLALMALPTVKVRDTQPATGMLYVACVLVLVGEGVAHYLGIKTGVPI